MKNIKPPGDSLPCSLQTDHCIIFLHAVEPRYWETGGEPGSLRRRWTKHADITHNQTWKMIYREVVMKLISSACIRYSPINEWQRKVNQDSGTADRPQPGYLPSVVYKKQPKQRQEDQSMWYAIVASSEIMYIFYCPRRRSTLTWNMHHPHMHSSLGDDRQGWFTAPFLNSILHSVMQIADKR